MTTPAFGQWATIPGTVLNPFLVTVAEVGGTWAGEIAAPTAWAPWTSMCWDAVNRIGYLPRPGGHTDYGGAESYKLDLNSSAWSRVEPVQHLTVINPSDGCPFPTYGGPSTHTYDGVAYLGNGRLYVAGGPAFRRTGIGHGTSYFVDTTTNPWTWTEQPQLIPYSGIAASDVVGQYLYLMEDAGKWAKVDKDTGAIVTSGTIGPVKKNGVNLSTTSSFGALMSAGKISTEGYLVVGTGLAINTSNINGTLSADGLNDDRFGKVLRRPVGTGAPAGSIQSGITTGEYAVVTCPNGWMAIWQGGKKVYLFKPGANNDTSLDQWAVFDPATGPVTGTSHIYNRMFWDATTQCLIGYSNKDDTAWMFNPFAPTNLPPVAVDDNFTGNEDTQITGNILANDTDDHGPLTVTVLQGPAVGTLVLQPNGDYTYDAPLNFNGQVSFTYTVTDGTFSDVGAVTITVIAVNDVPVANDTSFTFDEDTVLSNTLAPFASDPVEGSPLTFSIVTAPARGVLVLNANGAFNYTPALDDNGQLFFVYGVSDGTDSSQATVTLNITPVADLVGTPDFETRRTTPGVFFSQGFDPDFVMPTGSSKDESVFLNQGQGVLPVTQNGALHFTIPGMSAAGTSGQYQVQFSKPQWLGHSIKGVGFDGGAQNEIWVQWRQYIPQALARTCYKNLTGGNTTFKIMTLSQAGNNLNTLSENVFVADNWEEIPDGQPMHKNFSGYYEGGAYKNWTVSNGNGATGFKSDFQPMDVYTWQPPTGLSQVASTAHQTWAGHRDGTIEIQPDAWHTWMVRYRLGQSFTADDGGHRRLVHLEVWQKMDGAEPIKIIDQYRGHKGNATDLVGWGSVWFTPYMTARNPNIDFGDTYTDIDEVILSTQFIPWSSV